MHTPGFATRSAPVYDGPRPIEALTTSCEGLWLLQALCGVETLPSVLVVRPFIADADPPTGHPGLAVLEEAGAIVAGTVHPQIQVWLETLGAPDVVLCCMVSRGGAHLRVAIARRDAMTVAASRHDDDIVVESIGGVPSMRSLLGRLLPMCGPDTAPADFKPIMVPTADLVDGLGAVVRGEHTPAVVLGRLGLDPDQRRIVTAMSDRPEMELSVAVVRRDERGDHVGIASVTVADTDAGRVVAGPVRSDNGSWWTMIAPGTLDAAARALDTLLQTVDIASWNEHSRG
jgi:hypothetical protein